MEPWRPGSGPCSSGERLACHALPGKQAKNGGKGGKSAGLRAERLAAAAAAGGVRVGDLEAAAHELVDEVDADAVQQGGVHRVHEELDAVGREGLLAGLGGLGELHPVGGAGAAA